MATYSDEQVAQRFDVRTGSVRLYKKTLRTIGKIGVGQSLRDEHLPLFEMAVDYHEDGLSWSQAINKACGIQDASTVESMVQTIDCGVMDQIAQDEESKNLLVQILEELKAIRKAVEGK